MLVRIFTLLFGVLVATQSMAQITFPTLRADDLNGRSVMLPADFPGDPTIVFIAFKQRQQSNINAWVSRLGLQETGGPAWVELPVVGQGAALIRPIVDNGMRSGITSTAMRARTITIYSNRRAFNQALNIPDMNQIYVALVDRSGRIRALISGDVTEAKVAALRSVYP